jgi:hypothetical protein
MIYIELLTSRPPLLFRNSSKSFREERNIERKIFEALRRVTIVGKGVTTLTLGLRVRANNKARESHFMLLKV